MMSAHLRPSMNSPRPPNTRASNNKIATAPMGCSFRPFATVCAQFLRGETPLNAKSPGAMAGALRHSWETGLHHSHSTHATHTAGGCCRCGGRIVLFRLVGHGCLGGEEESDDR